VKLQDYIIPLEVPQLAPEIQEFFDLLDKKMRELTAFDYSPLMELRVEPTHKTIERMRLFR